MGILKPDRIESWFEAVHPEDVERVTQGTIHSTSTGEPFEQTLRVYHSEKKEYIWVYCRATAEFDSEGQPTHFNGLILDISGFKRIEQSIQESCQEIKNLIEDLKQKITQPKGVEEWLSYSEEKLKTIVEHTSNLL
jgi:hypothetical protein